MKGVEAKTRRGNPETSQLHRERLLFNRIRGVAGEVKQTARLIVLLPEAAVVFSLSGLAIGKSEKEKIQKSVTKLKAKVARDIKKTREKVAKARGDTSSTSESGSNKEVKDELAERRKKKEEDKKK